ncbi:acyltransferase [Oesophagostomum dentatum]|uniref:Acyltransferase n=1 Tax=Oesophagostomum dentatum TaxID=61180 RepID=A0A0B1TL23_OESDE|nr:acyltransferase [Oesophagostomum dentatum]
MFLREKKNEQVPENLIVPTQLLSIPARVAVLNSVVPWRMKVQLISFFSGTTEKCNRLDCDERGSLGSRCRKCEIVDCMPVLVDETGEYLAYDPKTNFIYIDPANHFSNFGKARIQIITMPRSHHESSSRDPCVTETEDEADKGFIKKALVVTPISLRQKTRQTKDTMSQKREDIQGIRAWAIALVLLFHFFPSFFPNGYVGVDMFFVVSGFLMAMIISRSKDINAETFATFYYKRIKRILPLYYLVLFLILLVVIFVLPSLFRQLNLPSSRRAIFLISNIRETEDINQQYENMNSYPEKSVVEVNRQPGIEQDTVENGPYFGVFVSGFLAAVTYKYYEETYLRMSPPAVISLIFGLLCGCVLLSLQPERVDVIHIYLAKVDM